jgi:hypothetical protein
MAIVAAASLAGCFSSRSQLIQPEDGIRLLGESGAAKRVDFGMINSAPSRVTFQWTGDAYLTKDPREPRGKPQFRIAELRDEWLITQRTESGVSVYGLARREGDRLWTYSPACQDLSDADRAAVNVTLEADGMCWLRTESQLRSAMSRSLSKGLQPDGYFELTK